MNINAFCGWLSETIAISAMIRSLKNAMFYCPDQPIIAAVHISR